MLAIPSGQAPPAMTLAATAVESPPASADHTAGGGLRAVPFLQCLIGTATVLAVAWLGWALVARTVRRRLGGRLGTGGLSEPHQRGGLSPSRTVGGAGALLSAGGGCIAAVAIHPPRRRFSSDAWRAFSCCWSRCWCWRQPSRRWSTGGERAGPAAAAGQAGRPWAG